MLKLTPRKDKAASVSDTGSNALDVLQSRNAKVKNDDAFEASTDDAERLITVSIDDIDLYTNNPRRAKNERYDEIKESIRSNGLRNPPDITKAPNSDRYMAVSYTHLTLPTKA